MTEARAYQMLRVVDDGGVRTITLDRPARRNALGPRLINELLYAHSDATEDQRVRVIVLTGAGAAFCAGADFSEFSSGAGDDAGLPNKGDFADLLLALVRSPKPIIARVNGYAMGGGLGLVAASTFAVADEAAEMGTPEINVGLFPMMIMAVLARVVPRRRLVEMMLFGERFGAPEAVRIGLINRAVPAPELDRAVAAMADRLCAHSPSTIALGLGAFAAQDDLALADALPLLRERLGTCLATDDAREGLLAYLEKRPPKWPSVAAVEGGKVSL